MNSANKTGWTTFSDESNNKVNIFKENLVKTISLFNKHHISEATDNNFSSKLQNISSWQEFKNKGKLIGKLLGIPEEKVETELTKLGDTLATLVPDGGAEEGFNYIEQIKNTISSSKAVDGLTPPLTTDHFLELVGKNMASSVKILADIITTRKKRKFMEFIGNIDTIGIKSISDIQNIVAKQVRATPEEISMAFNALVNIGKFEKSSAPVGKGEIALAMMFGDCVLADDSGDVKAGSKYPIEVKSSQGVISSRFYIKDNTWESFLINSNNKTWTRIRTNISEARPNTIDSDTQEEYSDIKPLRSRRKQTVKTEIDPNDPEVIIEKFTNAKNLPKEMTKREQEVMFAYLFGHKFFEYEKNSKYNKLVVVDTTSDRGLAIFNAPQEPADDIGYYNLGVKVLDAAVSQRLAISLGRRTSKDAGGECGFKLSFNK